MVIIIIHMKSKIKNSLIISIVMLTTIQTMSMLIEKHQKCRELILKENFSLNNRIEIVFWPGALFYLNYSYHLLVEIQLLPPLSYYDNQIDNRTLLQHNGNNIRPMKLGCWTIVSHYVSLSVKVWWTWFNLPIVQFFFFSWSLIWNQYPPRVLRERPQSCVLTIAKDI